MMQYLLAAHCEHVFMLPEGALPLIPPIAEAPFLKSFLERWEVDVQLLRRSIYKTAGNMFIKDGFDKHHRENLTELLNDLAENFVEKIQGLRGDRLSEKFNAKQFL